MSTFIPTSDLDLYSDEVLSEPYEHYQRLRDAGPAVWLERYNAWAIAATMLFVLYSETGRRSRQPPVSHSTTPSTQR